MKALYCQYCGELLSERCGCEREVAEARAQQVEDYENNPETWAGWANEDLCFNRHREQ